MNTSHNYRYSAAIGGVVWLFVGTVATLGIVQLALFERIFLLAPLVIVPLGLALVPTDNAQLQRRLNMVTQYLQPVGAALVTVAFLWPVGLGSGAAAAGWFLVTGLVGLLGLTRIFYRHSLQANEIVLTAGLLYLPVGGGWLVLSRLGLRPLGFSDLIVLLTAMHFHYAGFAAPIIAYQTGQRLVNVPALAKNLYRFSVAAIVAGMPLVAAGITASRLVEVGGAVFLASGLIILAVLLVYVSRFVLKQRPVQVLLTVSGICLMLGMAFTFGYVLGNPPISIPQMISSHGVLNAIGFALCGLLGWTIVDIPT